MFTLEQIYSAHAKVKSGADFPAYVQELIQLGVSSYSIYVENGRTEYRGNHNFTVTSDAQYPLMAVAPKGDKHKLGHALKIHQQGQTDYLTFCRQAAEAGVERWTVDMQKMTCEYFDKWDKVLVKEKIPAA